MKRLIGFLALLCSICTLAFAQNETSKWYFGSSAAVDFLGGFPAAITNSVMSSSEGSASIAGAGGNLLFYTNGLTIWNANHVAMLNGTGLFGSSISCQSAVIVRQPGSATLYYVFTMRNWTDGGNGAHFSIVDMSLGGGFGDVTTKNQLVYGNTRESLTAVCHANGTDAWIVIHDMFTNEFRSYLLDASGLSVVPVISAVGSVFTGGNRYGALKASPDGNRLGYALGGAATATTEIYDFNRTTGVVSNPLTLNNGGVYSNAYGIEFSPNNQVLYVCEYNGNSIQQYNLAAGTPALVQASVTNIATGVNTKANLQLGPDNKIYVCLAYQTFLGVINNPNTVGLGSGFVNNSLNLSGRTCGLGLPNFMPCLIPIILPLQWRHLDAKPIEEGVHIQWGLSQLNAGSSFAVERRMESEAQFKEIGQLRSLDQSPQEYQWVDRNMRNGNASYRIALLQPNGETQYSNTIEVHSGPQAIRLELYPNPASATDIIHIKVENYAGELQLEVLNPTLQVIAHWKRNVQEGERIPLQLQNLPSGIYFLKIHAANGYAETRKFLKQ